jgi:hypothetical protein
MSQLSEEVLDEGRALIRAKDLDGFIAWIGKNKIDIDTEVVKQTYGMCFRFDDTEKALRLFEQVFPGIDPTAQAIGTFIKQGCALFVLLGLIGGFLYLFRSCTG